MIDIQVFPDPNWHNGLMWVVILGFIFAAVLAFGMGANDCANSYGCVVGAKVLSLWQVYTIATFTETAGAMLMGYRVIETMRSGIIDTSVYNFANFQNSSNESITTFSPCNNGTREFYHNRMLNCTNYSSAELVVGELAALIGTAFWLICATFFHMPVSTTQSSVGGTIGFSLVMRGADGINWPVIGKVVSSWVISPLLSGFVGSVFFLIIRTTALKKEDPFEASLHNLPYWFLFMVTATSFPVLFHGSKFLHLDGLTWEAVFIALCLGLGVSWFMWAKGIDLARKRAIKLYENDIRRERERVINGDLKSGGRAWYKKFKMSRQGSGINTPASVVTIQTKVPSNSTNQSGKSSPRKKSSVKTNRQSSEDAGFLRVETLKKEARINKDDGLPSMELQKQNTKINARDGLPPMTGSSSPNKGVSFILPHISERIPVNADFESGTNTPNTISNGKLSFTDSPGPSSPWLAETGSSTADLLSAATSAPASAFPSAPSSRPGGVNPMKDGKAVDPKSLASRLKELARPAEEDPKTIKVYHMLQIFSACFLSFSHGSNDTANAIGPLIGLFIVYSHGSASYKIQSDGQAELIILFGALTMVVGLWVLGHKVIKTIGRDITEVTSPCGYSMELATAVTVLYGSYLKLPLSTTHCMVGAVAIVGFVRTRKNGVSWKMMGNIAFAWIVTMPVTMAVSALITYVLAKFFLHTM